MVQSIMLDQGFTLAMVLLSIYFVSDSVMAERVVEIGTR